MDRKVQIWVDKDGLRLEPVGTFYPKIQQTAVFLILPLTYTLSSIEILRLPVFQLKQSLVHQNVSPLVQIYSESLPGVPRVPI